MLTRLHTQYPTIGISLFTHDGKTVWDSDLQQNVAFLAMMLKRSARTGPIYFLNGGDARALPDGFDLACLGVHLAQPRDVTHELDVVIEMGAQMPVDWLRHMQRLGKKLVAYHVGQTYSRLCETPMFGSPADRLLNSGLFDEVWISPDVEKIDAPLLRTLMRAPVHAVPPLWSPHFMDRRIAELATDDVTFGYRPGRKSWRLATLEPNVSVGKSCHYPMLVCEEFFRTRSEAVEHMFVVNSMHMKGHPTFLHFASSLDLVRRHKATFEPRIDLPGFMSRHADAVVTHHWENAQSYLYYDVLYGDYPLVHNSTMLGGAGYYYPDFDPQAGGRALLDAWLHHDGQLADYRRKARALLTSVSIDNAANQAAFIARLAA